MARTRRTWAWLACAGLWPAALAAEPGLGIVDSVRMTLGAGPAIHLQTARVRESLGQLGAARGAFATRLSTSIGVGRDRTPLSALQQAQLPGLTGSITDSSFYRAGLQRRFRTGLLLASTVELARSRLSATGSAPGALVLPTDNVARVNLRAVQPLLSGAGAAAVGTESAAGRAYEAALLQLRHELSASAAVTAIAYWNYAAAERFAGINASSEQRSATLLEQTEVLVRSDQRPAADLNPLRADLADKNALRIGGQQQLYQARIELGRAMGLPAQDSAALPPARDPLPQAGDVALAPALAAGAYAEHATARRADLHGSRRRAAAALALLRAAEVNSRHRLDLSANLGYTGLDQGSAAERYFSALGENVNGANYGVALEYEYQFGNEGPRGERLVRQAQYEQALIVEQDLERRIRGEVAVAVNEVLASHRALASSAQAVDAHAQALDAEQKRFRQGIATLFNLLLFQDRLKLAQVQHVQAQLRLAVALVRLRHETSSLLRAGEDPAPELRDLLSVPAP